MDLQLFVLVASGFATTILEAWRGLLIVLDLDHQLPEIITENKGSMFSRGDHQSAVAVMDSSALVIGSSIERSTISLPWLDIIPPITFRSGQRYRPC